MSNAPKTSRRAVTELLDPEFMARLDALDVLSRKVFQGKLQGERRSKRRGRSVEFADHRRYVEGDDLRFVDWNIFGRLDQFFLKLFLAEEDLTVHVMLDASASMSQGEPPKDRMVKKLTAALAYVALVKNNRVTVSTFDDGVRSQLSQMRGRRYLPRLAELLLTSAPAGASDFAKACRQVAAARTGSGVLLVLSDFLFKEGYQEGLRRLVSRNYDLYAIQVLSPQEISPTISGDLKLVDVEDADAAEITVSAALLDYYKRNVSGYCNELKQFCARRGATHVLAASGDSVEDLMLKYLRRRGLLG